VPELVDLESRPASLASIAAGRPALLFFYKSDCPTSAVAADVLPRFAAAVPGLAVVAVSQDDITATRAFSDAHGWRAIHVLRDPEPWRASDAFAVRATPTWFLIDAGGTTVAADEGWSRDAANALAREAARLRGGVPATQVAPEDGSLPAFRPG
jgi:peroxiredoxin